MKHGWRWRQWVCEMVASLILCAVSAAFLIALYVWILPLKGR